MENPLDRLSWVRERINLNSGGFSKKAFAESIGLTASSFNNMYTRKSKVSIVLANSVELVHGIRAEWLLTGKGKKLKLSDRLKRRYLKKLEREIRWLRLENESFERLKDALKRKANAELLTSGLDITEIINQKAQQLFDVRRKQLGNFDLTPVSPNSKDRHAGRQTGRN